MAAATSQGPPPRLLPRCTPTPARARTPSPWLVFTPEAHGAASHAPERQHFLQVAPVPANTLESPRPTSR